jgi:hypothetical protein
MNWKLAARIYIECLKHGESEQAKQGADAEIMKMAANQDDVGQIISNLRDEVDRLKDRVNDVIVEREDAREAYDTACSSFEDLTRYEWGQDEVIYVHEINKVTSLMACQIDLWSPSDPSQGDLS